MIEGITNDLITILPYVLAASPFLYLTVNWIVKKWEASVRTYAMDVAMRNCELSFEKAAREFDEKIDSVSYDRQLYIDSLVKYLEAGK